MGKDSTTWIILGGLAAALYIAYQTAKKKCPGKSNSFCTWFNDTFPATATTATTTSTPAGSSGDIVTQLIASAGNVNLTPDQWCAVLVKIRSSCVLINLDQLFGTSGTPTRNQVYSAADFI